jgi:hypothetical protein
MPQNFELRIPNSGMNKDDESRLVEKNESRFILNLRTGSSEDSNVGALENIKGTTQVLFDLPLGRNVCIGSYGDQTTHTNFFFVYNSLNTHSIYRYIPEDRTVRLLIQGPLLNFKEDSLINGVNVIDNLLYWNDGVNPQRKINIDKADVDMPGFRQKFNYYFGNEYLKEFSDPVIRIEVREKRYSPVIYTGDFTLSVTQTNPFNKRDVAQEIATQLNNIVIPISSPPSWEAKACGEFTEIETKTDHFLSFRSLDAVGNETIQIIPENHYQEYIERVIDVIKHPPQINLTATFQTDEDFSRNFVKDKVFQFAARYIYDDNEKSVVSPRSPHVYNKFTCPQFTDDDRSNYIRVSLSSFKAITDFDSLQVVKRIELYVREGELGDWKSVTEILQKDFVDIRNREYNFYNDSIYNTVDQSSFVVPFHNVPILSKTQEAVKNRLFYANNLEQYDPVCINSELDVTYDDVESRVEPKSHNISGAVFIRSNFNGDPDGGTTDKATSLHQAIRKDISKSGNGAAETDKTVWGGVSESGASVSKDMFNETGQVLPLDGFTIYLAGTDYRTVSRQVVAAGASTRPDVSQTSKGVFFNPDGGGTTSHILQLRSLMESNFLFPPSPDDPLIKWNEPQSTQVFSEFTIPNVPDGWYILRVASHKTTKADYDDPNRGYQKTSTNVYQITNLDRASNGSGDKSQERGVGELLIQVKGGDIPRIKIEILDMSHGKGQSKICTGYIVDNDVSSAPSTFDGLLTNSRIS